MKVFRNMARKAESEKALEARLVDEVKKRGGMAVKLTSQFHRGMPDRLCVLPFHTIAFVEMKSTGEKPTALQEAAMAQLRSMRFTVRVVDSTETLDELLQGFDERLAEQAENDAELQAKRKAMKRAFYQKRREEKSMERLMERFDDEV